MTDEREPGRDRLPHVGGRPVEQLDRPRLGGVASQLARTLEVGQVRVHGRGGGEADGLADVPHRRRIPEVRRIAFDEVEDLLLALGQVHAINSLMIGP